MTVIVFPKINRIKGNQEDKDRWRELRDLVRKRKKLKLRDCEYLDIDWIIVIQQHDDHKKAIVMEKIIFTDECVEKIRKRVPEAVVDPEIRITWWSYRNKGVWKPEKEIKEGRIELIPPVLIPVRDFTKLIHLFTLLEIHRKDLSVLDQLLGCEYDIFEVDGNEGNNDDDWEEYDRLVEETRRESIRLIAARPLPGYEYLRSRRIS